MATLTRTDRNGTKYWTETKCPKCGGERYIAGYEHVEGGVCFLCGGTGYYPHHWKEYTPEYARKLAERRLAKARAKADEINAKYLADLGFSADGKAWIVLGDTYAIKDALKAQGAKFSNGFGWHFDHADNGHECAEIDIADVSHRDEANTIALDAFVDIAAYVDALKAAHAPKDAPVSEYVGNIGDRIALALTFVREFRYETHYTYHGETNYIEKFKDADGNVIVWRTTSYVETMEAGKTYLVKGTIKAHDEYKGEKQTVLTRCKITAEEGIR